MSRRLEIAERLLAHAEVYDEAATPYLDHSIAVDLMRLAEDCREAVFAIIEEMGPIRVH